MLDILKDYDVIVDGVDNFPTRYLLNDAALKLGKPVVHASIYRFEGQITCFIPGEGPCYRCLYPEPPPPDMAPSCQEAGVLGVLPGVVGVLQATEAIKIVLGVGKTLAGRLLMYDALATKFRELKLRRDPEVPDLRRGRRPQPDPAHRLRAVLRCALAAVEDPFRGAGRPRRPEVLGNQGSNVRTPAPRMASCLRAASAWLAASSGNSSLWARTANRAASARKAWPSARVLLATVRSTRSR